VYATSALPKPIAKNVCGTSEFCPTNIPKVNPTTTKPKDESVPAEPVSPSTPICQSSDLKNSHGLIIPIEIY
jgi:hypothetical protein